MQIETQNPLLDFINGPLATHNYRLMRRISTWSEEVPEMRDVDFDLAMDIHQIIQDLCEQTISALAACSEQAQQWKIKISGG